jgi:hypothetical protein
LGLRKLGSLCTPGWPETHYVLQAVLELIILLPQPPSVGITGMNHHTQLNGCLQQKLKQQKEKNVYDFTFYFTV